VEIQHEPVMPREVLKYLEPTRRDGIFIDCTLGEGGHSERILNAYSHIRLVGIDADASIQAKAKQRLAGFSDRTVFYNLYFDEFFPTILWMSGPTGCCSIWGYPYSIMPRAGGVFRSSKTRNWICG
jgi:16S rRNA C1402 N4-methylase RsmH